MGAPTRMLALAAGALMLGALVGCTPGVPKPTRTPTASQTPLFASDEAALKAATDAYAAYLKMSDTILADGGKEPDRMTRTAVGDALATELTGFETARKRGWRQVGSTTFSGTQLQSTALDSVSIYVCVDVSNVDILNSSGKSVVSANRPERSAALIRLIEAGGQPPLKVAANQPWNGNGVC